MVQVYNQSWAEQMLSGFWKQMIKARSKSEYTEVTSRWQFSPFLFLRVMNFMKH